MRKGQGGCIKQKAIKSVKQTQYFRTAPFAAAVFHAGFSPSYMRISYSINIKSSANRHEKFLLTSLSAAGAANHLPI